METDEEHYILPDEVWEEVFGWLTHTEKLISRFVCSDWNRLISSNLSKNSFFSLTTAPSQQVLIDSSVPWKKISLRYDTHLSLPSIYKDLITTARVIIRCWSEFKDCLNFLTQFQNLINLYVDLKISDKESEIKMTKDHEFKENVSRLIKLSIKFSYNNYKGLKQFLEYVPEKLCLTKVSVKEDREDRATYQEIGQRESNRAEWLYPKLFNIISRSSGTLKFLELEFYSKSVRENLFSQLVQNLCTLQDLKLETILIRPEVLGAWDPTENAESDFDIHQKFLEIQIGGGGVVKRLLLPWCSNGNLCEQFMLKLPRDIEFIGSLRKEHMRDSIYRNIPKLKSMFFTGPRELTLFTQPCPNIKTFSIDLKYSFALPENQMFMFYTSLGQTLPNLVELHIERGMIGRPSFYDHDLQLIIYYFRQLRVLHIDRAEFISDLGVTGIEKKYINELSLTRRLYLGRQIPNENIIGLPLSSLRFLEKLRLKSPSLSDLGIYYGLRFGSTLKHLSICLTGNVSEWGLQHLGNGNPCLESFEGVFQSNAISKIARGSLIQLLPMVIYTNKFKFVNLGSIQAFD